ncbi:Uncharacterized protein Fot_51868 [Forsythia ovata]|uniref:Uncharacterized protein n=1 Tax=Forsythia ovata TaxID=205694 RepID=A0ABD1PWP7_9LAMI
MHVEPKAPSPLPHFKIHSASSSSLLPLSPHICSFSVNFSATYYNTHFTKAEKKGGEKGSKTEKYILEFTIYTPSPPPATRLHVSKPIFQLPIPDEVGGIRFLFLNEHLSISIITQRRTNHWVRTEQKFQPPRKATRLVGDAFNGSLQYEQHVQVVSVALLLSYYGYRIPPPVIGIVVIRLRVADA